MPTYLQPLLPRSLAWVPLPWVLSGGRDSGWIDGNVFLASNKKDDELDQIWLEPFYCDPRAVALLEEHSGTEIIRTCGDGFAFLHPRRDEGCFVADKWSVNDYYWPASAAIDRSEKFDRLIGIISRDTKNWQAVQPLSCT